MEIWNAIVNFIVASVLMGTTLMYGTLGEILTEKSGNLNLGVEGLIYMGGAAGLIAPYLYEQAAGEGASPIIGFILAILAGFLAAAFGSLIFSFLTITLRANQNVTGLALTIFGVGFGKFFGEYYRVKAGGRLVISADLDHLFTAKLFPDFLSNIPIIGKLFFSYNFMIYLSIIIAIAMAWMLNRSRVGLNLRSVGEDPATADAAGINVIRYKYLFTCIGGGICGLGGAYISLVTCAGNWQQDCVSGQGWIAVALVIFVSWKPAKALWGAFFFGALRILKLYVPASVISLPSAFYLMLPFAVTCVVLVLSSIRMRRENQAPAACGVNYFREER